MAKGKKNKNGKKVLWFFQRWGISMAFNLMNELIEQFIENEVEAHAAQVAADFLEKLVNVYTDLDKENKKQAKALWEQEKDTLMPALINLVAYELPKLKGKGFFAKHPLLIDQAVDALNLVVKNFGE